MQPASQMYIFLTQIQHYRCTGSCQYACVWPGLPANLSIPSEDHWGTVGSSKTSHRSIRNLDGIQHKVPSILKLFRKIHSSQYLRCFMTVWCIRGLCLSLLLTTGVFAFIKLQQRDFGTQEMYLCL